MSKTIFVVDDSDTNLAMAEEVLEKQYRVVTLSSGARMFALLEKITPDLILLDIEMPEMSGFEAMEQLKANDSYANIPVIFLTGLADSTNEAHGIELGAVDFITKPFSEPVLLNRIKNHIDRDELIRKRTAQLSERTAQLIRLQNGIVFTLADIVENRDKSTGGHIDRTTLYIKLLINAMKERGLYAEEMRHWDTELVISSARLHDVGKIAIPDIILNKPGSLTQEEFNTMKTHAAEGVRIIDQIVFRTGEAEFLCNAKLCAAYHHERWDGSGYPHGMKGANIPLQARVMALVDVYDALISERPYKKPFTEEEALRIIMEGSGKHFDPLVADVFVRIKDQIESVRAKLSQ